ncbi:hypothetical protein COLO4_21362 [Corchorus olitorius]|uniref:Uncharacterized protein n=1 Tax=Corchorus olitorius TaxID=93759 RepID=A0A1R3ITQ9_9ROSI|nr:hypothetical protein COLO4_21362 [Corchorus olitorius]
MDVAVYLEAVAEDKNQGAELAWKLELCPIDVMIANANCGSPVMSLCAPNTC